MNGHVDTSGLVTLVVDLTRELVLPAPTTYFAEATDAIRGILEDQDGVIARLGGRDLPNAIAAHLSSVCGGDALGRREILRRASPAKGEAILDVCTGKLVARLLAGEPWHIALT